MFPLRTAAEHSACEPTKVVTKVVVVRATETLPKGAMRAEASGTMRIAQPALFTMIAIPASVTPPSARGMDAIEHPLDHCKFSVQLDIAIHNVRQAYIRDNTAGPGRHFSGNI